MGGSEDVALPAIFAELFIHFRCVQYIPVNYTALQRLERRILPIDSKAK